ncbi:MAG: glycosyltransferase family 39 protein [Bryobacteraceae bacterium]|nr:glycosyltransferase family 39 protein [Bryobacteraceae bacterium]
MIEQGSKGAGAGAVEPLARSVLILAAVVAAFHLSTTGGYGIFRDELYYLACARRLDWGYVDHPPLVALMAWAVTHTLGTSLFALRLLPALSAGAAVLLAGATAREMGGGRFAQLLAGVAAALAPQYLGMMSIYSMNALDVVIWAALMLVFARILRTGDGRWWWAFGALAGIGLQNKLSVLMLGFGVAAGLAAARQWKLLLDRRLWCGAVLAAVIFLPHVIWQASNGWPTVEFVRNATQYKNVAFSPLGFFGQQVLMMNPVAAPLWLGGLGYVLFARRARPFRAVGAAYLAILLLMLTQSAKPYYLSPVYPALFAAGAAAVEGLKGIKGWAWARPVSLAAIGITGALFAPLAKPLLPVDQYAAYAGALGLRPASDERKEMGRLPQHFADMHGWRELAEAVAGVHNALPPGERERGCVFGQNYGQAGAIEFFGPPLGLPTAISGHNNYWLWGPGKCDGSIIIVIGGEREELGRSFEQVSEGGRYTCADCMPYEAEKILWVARGLRQPLAEVWPRVKHFD